MVKEEVRKASGGLREVLALPGAQHHPRRVKALRVAFLCIMNHDPLAHEDILNEWVTLSQAQGDLLETLWSLNMLCGFHYIRGDVALWKAFSQELLERLDAAERDTTLQTETALELQHLHAWALNNLGYVTLLTNRDLLQAQRYAEEAVERFERSGDVFGRLYVLLLVAEIKVRRGLPLEALEHLEDVFAVVGQGRFQALEGMVAQVLALLAESRGQAANAVRFMVLAEHLAQSADAPMGAPLPQLYEQLAPLLNRVQPVLGRASIQEAHEEGLQLTLEEAWARCKELGRLESRAGVLTPREREVINLVAQGHPDRRIAKLLGISPTTASKHVANLLAKLELRNRVELTRWVIEHGTDRTT